MRGWFPKPYADFVQRFRVAGGFVLLVAFLGLARPTAFSFAAGVPMAALGLGLRAWAAGHLAKNERLATAGPYAWTRNPLYLGSLVAAAGLAAAARSPVLALLFAAVFALVYLPAIEQEEWHLGKLFPDYDQYARRVPWLWPVRKPGRGAERFRWTLYLRNREYQALAGFVAAVLVLWSRL